MRPGNMSEGTVRRAPRGERIWGQRKARPEEAGEAGFGDEGWAIADLPTPTAEDLPMAAGR